MRITLKKEKWDESAARGENLHLLNEEHRWSRNLATKRNLGETESTNTHAEVNGHRMEHGCVLQTFNSQRETEEVFNNSNAVWPHGLSSACFPQKGALCYNSDFKSDAPFQIVVDFLTSVRKPMCSFGEANITVLLMNWEEPGSVCPDSNFDYLHAHDDIYFVYAHL